MFKNFLASISSEQKAFFFLSAGLFGLLVLISPVVSALLVGMGLQTVYAAPLLGFAMATTVYVLIRKSLSSIGLSLFAGLLFFSVIILFVGLSLMQVHYDQVFLNSGDADTARLIGSIAKPHIENMTTQVFLILCVPFFIYGLFLISAIEKWGSINVYKFEMLGALCGTLAVALILESAGFGSSLFFILSTIIIGVFFLTSAWLVRGFGLICLLLFVIGSFFKPEIFEPKRNPHLVIRDFRQRRQISVLDESWTTFAKVQALNVKTNHSSYGLVAIGDGVGIANLTVGRTPSISGAFPPLVQSLIPQAESVAVLFAGAGSELVEMDQLYAGKTRLLGIEINPQIIKTALKHSEPLRSIIESGKAELRQSEARQFLNEESEKFDAMIFSWSGATMAHYSGAIVHTTQFAFTSEAIEKAVGKIKPDGFLIIVGASKVNLLLSLKKMEKEGRLPLPLLQSVALLSPSPENSAWSRSWDDLILVWKNGKITEQEIQSLNTSTRGRFKVVSSPFNTTFPLIDNLIRSDDVGPSLDKLREVSGIYFNLHSDDRPFVYSAIAPEGPLSVRLWRQALSGGPFSGPLRIFLVAVTMSLLFLLSHLRANTTRKDSAFTGVSFLCGFVGSGLTLLILYRLLIYIGNPTSALLIGVGGGFFGAYIGTKWSERTSAWLSLGIAMITTSYLLIALQDLSFPLLITVFLVVAVAWGAVFPLLLKLAKNSNVQSLSLWSVDAWGAVAGTALIPVLLENIGFKETQIILVLGLTITILLLCLIQRNQSSISHKRS